MSQLHDFTTVDCPYEDVPGRLMHRFEGTRATFPLSLMVGDLRVERDVEIRFSEKPAYPGYRLLNVAWKPTDGGPYPPFEGTLSIADEGAGWCRIELDGSYQPPFGVAGAAFDAAVGHRIAEATAAQLLTEFKRMLHAPSAPRT